MKKHSHGTRRGLTALQLSREIERIHRKQAKGEELTKKEWRILAYGMSPNRCTCNTYHVDT